MTKFPSGRNAKMNTEEIAELVDGFIDQLAWEFNQLGKEITAHVEDAGREVQALGLSQEEAPRLVFDLANPMGSIQTSQERCRRHMSNISNILDGLDPEEEKLARILIHKGLRELHSEINSLFSPND